VSIWSDAWNEASKLANWAAAAGYSASKVRDVPPERVDLMRRMFDNLRKADHAAFNEVVCEYAQHAANGIAEVVGLRAELEAERASRPAIDDDPTPVAPAVPPPPEAKGEP
jgi:hypothetical protein